MRKPAKKEVKKRKPVVLTGLRQLPVCYGDGKIQHSWELLLNSKKYGVSICKGCGLLKLDDKEKTEFFKPFQRKRVKQES